jgi:hypothetical protein
VRTVRGFVSEWATPSCVRPCATGFSRKSVDQYIHITSTRVSELHVSQSDVNVASLERTDEREACVSVIAMSLFVCEKNG